MGKIFPKHQKSHFSAIFGTFCSLPNYQPGLFSEIKLVIFPTLWLSDLMQNITKTSWAIFEILNWEGTEEQNQIYGKCPLEQESIKKLTLIIPD